MRQLPEPVELPLVMAPTFQLAPSVDFSIAFNSMKARAAGALQREVRPTDACVDELRDDRQRRGDRQEREQGFGELLKARREPRLGDSSVRASRLTHGASVRLQRRGLAVVLMALTNRSSSFQGSAA